MNQDDQSAADPYALASSNLQPDDDVLMNQDVEPAPQENYDLNALTQLDGPVVREFDYFGSQDHFNPIDEESESSEMSMLSKEIMHANDSEDKSTYTDLANLFNNRDVSQPVSGLTTLFRNSTLNTKLG